MSTLHGDLEWWPTTVSSTVIGGNKERAPVIKRSAPSKTELAPGIFLFTTPSYGDVGLDMADG